MSVENRDRSSINVNDATEKLGQEPLGYIYLLKGVDPTHRITRIRLAACVRAGIKIGLKVEIFDPTGGILPFQEGDTKVKVKKGLPKNLNSAIGTSEDIFLHQSSEADGVVTVVVKPIGQIKTSFRDFIDKANELLTSPNPKYTQSGLSVANQEPDSIKPQMEVIEGVRILIRGGRSRLNLAVQAARSAELKIDIINEFTNRPYPSSEKIPDRQSYIVMLSETVEGAMGQYYINFKKLEKETN